VFLTVQKACKRAKKINQTDKTLSKMVSMEGPKYNKTHR
jgi:hypothetical protein